MRRLNWFIVCSLLAFSLSNIVRADDSFNPSRMFSDMFDDSSDRHHHRRPPPPPRFPPPPPYRQGYAPGYGSVQNVPQNYAPQPAVQNYAPQPPVQPQSGWAPTAPAYQTPAPQPPMQMPGYGGYQPAPAPMPASQPMHAAEAAPQPEPPPPPMNAPVPPPAPETVMFDGKAVKFRPMNPDGSTRE